MSRYNSSTIVYYTIKSLYIALKFCKCVSVMSEIKRINDIKISPSLLAADFTNLGTEIDSVKSADYLHFDVMDGVFVPNISVGLPVLESVRKVTEIPLDVHLMITAPSRYTERFAQAGADIVVFHVEAEEPQNIMQSIAQLHKLGKRAGLSVKPGTPISALDGFLDTLDIVLIMTVEPGFGGQKFMVDMLPKITQLRSIINNKGIACEIEVDGGINLETAAMCIEAGADTLVAGSDIFNSPNRAERITMLRNSK